MNSEKLIFLHMPRTAGWTLFLALKADGGLGKIFKLGGQNDGTELGIDDFPANAGEEDFDAYYGHFSFGVHASISPSCRYVTVVREPVDRVLSYIEYLATRESGLDVDEFLRSNFEASNGMTKRLCGLGVRNGELYDFVSGTAVSPQPEITDEHLGQALENLDRHFRLVLRYESLAESLVMLKREFATGTLLSILNNSSGTLRLNKIRGQLPPQLIEDIRLRNRIDIRLYEEIVARFDKAVAAWPEEAKDEAWVTSYLMERIRYDQRDILDQEKATRKILEAVNDLNRRNGVRDTLRLVRVLLDCKDVQGELRAVLNGFVESNPQP